MANSPPLCRIRRKSSASLGLSCRSATTREGSAPGRAASSSPTRTSANVTVPLRRSCTEAQPGKQKRPPVKWEATASLHGSSICSGIEPKMRSHSRLQIAMSSSQCISCSVISATLGVNWMRSCVKAEAATGTDSARRAPRKASRASRLCSPPAAAARGAPRKEESSAEPCFRGSGSASVCSGRPRAASPPLGGMLERPRGGAG
mmetsp:Transcript_100312/g.299381  ORF Transcript_100312/g.299381 Transcript_100312/m.299381 type:complete len:204 (+) Transcript_100312:625-1236(+)